MASWVLAHPPWHTLARVRLRWDVLVKSGAWTSKQFLSTPPLTMETPAMREIKAYPYPAMAPDASLFEETTEEYHEAEGETEAHTGLYPLHVEVDHPSTLLKNLVKEGKYSDATRVHAELVEIGVDISLHPAYHFAARQALRNPALSQQERLETFVKWWSLFPPRPEVEEPLRAIGSVLTDLFRNDVAPDIALIGQFAILAASKGYAHAVWRDVIPVVTRYAPSRVLLRLLEKVCAAAQGFEMSIAHDDEASKDAADRALSAELTRWYSLAIKELVSLGRTRVALEILQSARSRDIRVTLHTYAVLLEHLRSESAVDAVATVLSLRWVQRGHPSWLETPAEEAILPSLKSSPSAAQQPGTLPSPSAEIPQAPEDDTGASTPAPNEMQALITITRSLKHALASGTLSLTARSLSEVIAAYVKAGRSTLLCRLRFLAYRHNNLIPLWALAEMVNHDSCRRSLYTIMKEFESHFHVVGIPRGFADALWKERGAGRSSGIAQTRPPIRRKFPPTSEHTRFVWGLFLAKARTRSQVQRLYLQFLEDVAASRGIPPTAIPHIASLPSWKPATDPEAYIRPIPPPCLFDAGHFAFFIKAFDRLELPTVASRVVIDMYSLGIQPHPVVFTHLVSSLRYLPSDSSPVAALDFYEKALNDADSDRPPTEPSQSPANSLKAKTLAFIYAGVMRRLLLDNRVVEAAQVAQRFAASVPYRRRSSVVIEKVLREPAIASVLAYNRRHRATVTRPRLTRSAARAPP